MKIKIIKASELKPRMRVAVRGVVKKVTLSLISPEINVLFQGGSRPITFSPDQDIEIVI